MSYGLPSYILLRALETTLAALAAAATPKGTVITAHDPAQASELLGNAPNSWRLIIGIDDENAVNGEDASLDGLSATEVFVMVQAPIGLPMTAGKQIHRDSTAGIPSILEYAEAARSWMRGITYLHEALPTTCQVCFAWVSTSWVSKQEDGKPPQFARQHTFRVIHRIQSPTDIDPATLTWP